MFHVLLVPYPRTGRWHSVTLDGFSAGIVCSDATEVQQQSARFYRTGVFGARRLEVRALLRRAERLVDAR